MAKIKILILASNPIDTSRLRIDKEVKLIEESIQRSKYRDSFEIKAKWAVTTKDLRIALLEEKPNILHFTGHGAGNNPEEFLNQNTRDIIISGQNKQSAQNGCLIIENEAGTMDFIQPQALADLVGMRDYYIKCIVICACHSRHQAKLFSDKIDYTIGMNEAILDETALYFSQAFYEAIGNGETIPFSYDYAVKSIAIKNLQGKEIPQLNIKEGLIKHLASLSLLSNSQLTKEGKSIKSIAEEILDEFKRKRMKDVEDKIEMHRKLLASFESKLILEDFPNRIMAYEIKIENIISGIQSAQEEIQQIIESL